MTGHRSWTRVVIAGCVAGSALSSPRGEMSSSGSSTGLRPSASTARASSSHCARGRVMTTVSDIRGCVGLCLACGQDRMRVLLGEQVRSVLMHAQSGVGA